MSRIGKFIVEAATTIMLKYLARELIKQMRYSQAFMGAIRYCEDNNVECSTENVGKVFDYADRETDRIVSDIDIDRMWRESLNTLSDIN